MVKISNIIVFILLSSIVRGQNPVPTTTILNTALPVQSVDSYTRASVSINLKATSLTSGFKYGFVSGGATNLLNLNISTNPTFVPTTYLGSGTNPQTNGCANNGNVDFNKPVGETSGNFAVSASGAAIYNIPIIVSPGTKGIEPQLSISYNSQAGVGMLGTGWMLGGLSSISRCEKTLTQDGKKGGIELNADDVYAFDGNRLFALTGTYGQNGATYYTENESFSTITSILQAGNGGPQAFQVKDKNGNTMQYGYTPDSRLVGVNDLTVLSWYLNRVTDEYGNYMDYSYIQANGEIVIDKIEYTGNASASLLPYNLVKFEYIEIAEKTSFYIAGVEFRKKQLLKSITSYSGNTLVRKYILDYDWSSGTYLASVKEMDSNGIELNPTVFCWADPSDFGGTKDFQYTDMFANQSDYTNLNPIAADLNGDGFSDYVCVYPQDGRIRIMRNDFKNNYGTPNTDIQFNQTSDNLNQVPGATKLMSANVTDDNLDNKQEVYTIFGKPTGQAFFNYSIVKTTLSPNTSITNIGNFVVSGGYDPDFKPGQFYYDVRDYSGDGINDVLRIDPKSINLTTALGTVVFSIPTSSSIVRPISFNNDGVPEYLLLEHPSSTVVSVKVLSLTVNGPNQSFTQIYSNTYNFAGNTGQFAKNMLKNFGAGDFNGDGIEDLLYLNESFNKMFIVTGTGNGFLAPTTVNAFTPLQNSSSIQYDLNVIDINGDGKSDVTINDNVSQANNNPVDNYFSYYSLGNFMIKGASYSGNWTFNKTTVWYNEPVEANGVTYTGGWNVPVTLLTGYKIKADFNGDGIYDVTSFNGGADRTIANNVNGKIRYSIVSILSPLHKRFDINYANISSEIFVASGGVKEEIFIKQSVINYSSPLYNYKPNLYCVNSTNELSGYNYQISRRKKYVYSDAIMHNQGRGFLGFEQVMVFDRFNKIGTITKSVFNTAFNVALNTENLDGKISSSINGQGVTIYNIDNTKLIARNTNAISLVPRFTKGYFISVDQNTAKDYLNSTQATTSLIYNLNNFGNLVSKNTIYGWTGNPVIKTIQCNYTYVLSNGYYKLQSETTTQTQASDPSYARTTQYNYDPQGHLSSKISDPTFGNQMLVTTYGQFNLFGSPTTENITAGDVPARSVSVEYEVTGRFITKKTNALGNISEYVHDPRNGNILEKKDITGLVTKYSYDGVGRLIKTTLPNLATNKVTYAWDDPGTSYTYAPLRVGVYSIKAEVEGKGYSKVYCMGNGTVIRKETQDFAGQIVVTDTKYNFGTNFVYPFGEILETTEPHYIGQSKYLIKRYDYETIFYRPLSETTFSVNGGSPNNTGIFLQNTYNNPSTDAAYNQGFENTINQNNQQVTKLINEAGQTIKIQNTYPGSQQNSLYVYNSNGNPKTITLTNNVNPGQNIIQSFSYNNLGQNIQKIDPTTGTINYQYNTIGEILQQSDPNSTFTYVYDVMGRMVTKTGNISGTTTYQYVTTGNGKEMLEKIIGTNSISEYKYDNLNRLTEGKETIGNKVLKTNYAYDMYGRETEHTYPSGYIIKNQFNSLGFLTSITDNNNQSIWQLANEDAMGRITEYNYGNGINTKNKFDDLNYLIEVNHGNGSIHKQTYLYNGLTGNLTSRVFNNYITATNLKETFNFDAIDRLTQAKQVDPASNNQLQVNNTSFDIIGNITHKDDAGDLVYSNPNKPFTLTNISNPTNNIGLNTLSVLYNDFKKVKQISEMVTNKQFDFTYGTDDERIKNEYSINGINQYTRFYGENYDRQETGVGYKEWNYIFAPSGLCAVYYNNNGSGQLLYTLTDHLESPILLTNQSQQIVEEYAFDSWGRRRNPINWSYSGIVIPQFMIRGFTLHEHIDELALINMNGRIYDPVIGRFIQPDNYIQSPEMLQNFNRYAYCLNNPLRYSDPSGNLFEDLKGGFQTFFSDLLHASPGSSYVGNAQLENNAAEAAAVAFAYTKIMAKIEVVVFATVLSCGFAAVGAGIGVTGFVAGAFWGGFTGALVGAFSGGLNSYIDGGNVKEGAGKGAMWGGILGGVGGGISGGIDAVKGGKNFWTGEENISISTFKQTGLKLDGKPVQPEELDDFVEKHFGDRINKMKYKPTISINDAQVPSNAEAATFGTPKAGPSPIYLRRSTLMSDRRLYMVLDHELTHAELYSNGIFESWMNLYGMKRAKELSEVSAYMQNYNTAKAAGLGAWQNHYLMQARLNSLGLIH